MLECYQSASLKNNIKSSESLQQIIKGKRQKFIDVDINNKDIFNDINDFQNYSSPKIEKINFDPASEKINFYYNLNKKSQEIN